MRRQMREIRDGDGVIPDPRGQSRQLLMRQREESIEDAELVHQLQGRRVDGVAAEVAQEIGVLLQHHDVDAAAGEEKAEHHSRRSAPDHATGGPDLLMSRRNLALGRTGACSVHAPK